MTTPEHLRCFMHVSLEDLFWLVNCNLHWSNILEWYIYIIFIYLNKTKNESPNKLNDIFCFLWSTVYNLKKKIGMNCHYCALWKFVNDAKYWVQVPQLENVFCIHLKTLLHLKIVCGTVMEIFVTALSY